MAVTFQDQFGFPAGCKSLARVSGSTLSYSMNDSALGRVTVNFPHAADSQPNGVIKIACQPGGPTSNFVYTTIKPEGYPQYEIDTTADCSGPAPPAPPGPPGPKGYWCVQNVTCLYGPQPTPKFKGGTEEQCAAICHPPLYMCKAGQCVQSPTGGTLQECNAVC
jgi:hypothetical protein